MCPFCYSRRFYLSVVGVTVNTCGRLTWAFSKLRRFSLYVSLNRSIIKICAIQLKWTLLYRLLYTFTFLVFSFKGKQSAAVIIVLFYYFCLIISFEKYLWISWWVQLQLTLVHGRWRNLCWLHRRQLLSVDPVVWLDPNLKSSVVYPSHGVPTSLAAFPTRSYCN